MDRVIIIGGGNVSLDSFELPVVGIHRAELHQLFWQNVPREKLIFGRNI